MIPKKTTISTDDLFLMLEKEENIFDNWNELSQCMNVESFHNYLYNLISNKNISIQKVGVKAFLSRSFVYQIFSGARIPNRDIILRIALVLNISLDETQRLLKLANRGGLYPKMKRDAVIIYALNNHWGLEQTDEALIDLGQESLL